MIAALYVQPSGAYYDLPGVDPWDESRDARLYAGPWPVVAHPPCGRWCRLAGLVEARWGHKRGEDGGTFAAALAAVRRWGGVLEHPAYTDAWSAYHLPAPLRGSWQREMYGPGWVTEVSQVAYGHRGRKRTWLYAVTDYPPAMDWSEPEATAWVGNGDYDRPMPRIGPNESAHTPPKFRDALIAIARSAQAVEAA